MRGPAIILMLAGLWSWSGVAALEVGHTVTGTLTQAFSAVEQVLVGVDAGLAR